jgi:hypothetical protein
MDCSSINSILPTLFIALGCSGAEIVLRLRRRILTHDWGYDDRAISLDSIDEFPLAQFIHCDLTNDSLMLAGPEQFSDHEKFINNFYLNKYFRRNDDSRWLLYCLSKNGALFSIGNERLIRMEGLHADHLNLLESHVAELLERAVTLNHLAGLAVLYDYYAEQVYPSRIVRDEKGMDCLQASYAHVMCRKLAEETRESLRMKSSGAEDELPVRLINTLDTWTDVIEGSETDVYEHEVDRAHAAKRRVRKEFFNIGWPEPPACRSPEPGSEKPCMHCGKPTARTSKFSPDCGGRFEDMPLPVPAHQVATPSID